VSCGETSKTTTDYDDLCHWRYINWMTRRK
jgi:hypothetical protein